MFVDRRVALGHTRLAIIDLAGGAQPRVDEASGDALIFNGEVYGYRALAEELRGAGVALRDRSDTEVLFQLIRREGVRRAVARIDGMFAFAFRDGASGALYLVRDRFGEKPLYYGAGARRAGVRLRGRRAQMPPGFPRCGARPAGGLQLSVVRISAGHAIGLDRHRETRTGHDPDLRGRADQPRALLAPAGRRRQAADVDAGEAAERLGALLQASVRRRVVADVPVGVFLSGGIDSSLIAALAARGRARSDGVHRAGRRRELRRDAARDPGGAPSRFAPRDRRTRRRRSGRRASMRSATSSASRSAIRRCCRAIWCAARRGG